MSRNTEATDDVKTWTGGPLNYKEGFFTQLATDELAKGINEEVVRAISAKRNEPEWMLEFRLNAYHAWLEMEEPHWLKAHYDKLNYQDYSYYSAPSCGNCDDNCASEPGAVQQTGANAFLSKEVEAAFEQLGVPVREGKEVAVDAIFDSVSVATTYREKLAEQGIIFCSFGEAIHDHPELVRKYLGTVVPGNDNFFAALNAAVASDGTFIYVPKGVRCPMELSTYFRINAEKTGQFERTILVADEDSYNTGGIIGLGAALEYVSALGLNNIAEYEQNLMHYALAQLESVPDLTLYGPQNRLGVIAFNLGKHHAYDVGSFLDNYGIAVRTGHHCAMPLMAYYNVPAMCRASLAMYNTHEEVDRLVTGLQRIHRLLG